MKNKIMVMIVTFVIMIILTPVIFGKLMNSKFNTMTLKLQQQKGILIKEIKDKSSYLTTDRIFEVKIPGSLLNDNGIDYIEMTSEVKFKNLPVTNVYFHNIIKDVVLEDGEKLPFLKNAQIDVVTPNFKVYSFNIKPIKYKNFSLNSIKGNIEIKNETVKLNIDKIKATNNMFNINLNNISSLTQKTENFFKSENKFNLKLNFMGKEFAVNNVDIFNSIRMDKKTSINFHLSFENLKFSNIIKADDFNAKVKIYDLNTTLFEKAVNSKDKNLSIALLANGLKMEVNSSLKNVDLLNVNAGGFDLGIKALIHKTDNLEDFQLNPDKYLTILIKADISEKLAKILENYYPNLKSLLSVKPDNKGILHIKIDFDRGKIK